MKKALCIILVTLTLGLSCISNANSSPMPLDGSWTVLDEFFTAPAFFSGNWTWNSDSAVRLTVTDLYASTDRFNIYDSGVFVFSTSDLPDTYYVNEPDPDAALASGLFSSGWFIFGAGAHDITIEDIHVPLMGPDYGPYGDGTVAFKAEYAPVPEPSTFLLLGAGIAGLAFFRRKSRS